MLSQIKKIYKNQEQTQEEALYNIKRKTIPQNESDVWRNPLNNQQPWYQKQPKQYTETEIINQQHQYKQNYHNPFLKDLMQDATKVLLKLMEQEKI